MIGVLTQSLPCFISPLGVPNWFAKWPKDITVMMNSRDRRQLEPPQVQKYLLIFS